MDKFKIGDIVDFSYQINTSWGEIVGIAEKGVTCFSIRMIGPYMRGHTDDTHTKSGDNFWNVPIHHPSLKYHYKMENGQFLLDL